MQLKTLFRVIATLLFTQSLSAQTVVKMNLPPQSDEILQVVALFEEELPEGIPVVLGLMGYEVDGGLSPYRFEWLLNNTVISTSDIAIFTPHQGDDLVLKVTDQNQCRSTTEFNLKVFKGFSPPDENASSIRVYPTVFDAELYVELPEIPQKPALVRIFDLRGSVLHQEEIPSNTWLQLSLNPGVYFISVRSGDQHKVEKIIRK